MKHFCLLLIIIYFVSSPPLLAQQTVLPQEMTTTPTRWREKDSVLYKQQLADVTIVRAFEHEGILLNTPAAINVVSPDLLHQYGNASIVQAINATPGVRMEERSPGSYRLAIRGSSLRSPFGVRNVKIYYNGIPFTDPGGTTYLNQLGSYNIASLEILKGTGSSIYGAGTGGVMLIESIPKGWNEGVKAEITGGSYGLFNSLGEVRFGKDGFRNVIRYQRLTADGYRDHTGMNRETFSWDASTTGSSKTRLDAHFLYGNLAYETPGALTLREYDSAPRISRPRAGTSLSADETGAAIYQKTILAGLTVTHAFSDHFTHTTTLYGLYSQLYNPSIRNYAKSSEPNVGGRSVLKYSGNFRKIGIEWLGGAEVQQNFTTQQTYGNRGGRPDTLQADDQLYNRQLTGFTQLALYYKSWTLTAGLSINKSRLNYTRLSDLPSREQVVDFKDELSPRIALLKQWSTKLVTYTVVSRGFSPPTTAELSPSGSAVNLALQPEWGWNYELGARGQLFGQRLTYDLNLYYFALNNTIVQRRDAAGGDYYTNSGNTKQAGAELSLTYLLLRKETNPFGEARIRAAYTYQQFRYGQFIQLDQDYSGNRLPGVAPHTLAAGILLRSNLGAYLDVNYYFSDALPLDDGNTALNAAYHLLGARLGYAFHLKKQGSLEAFCGAENLTDVKYSAGPDINAFGGRYYNASPGRSFFAGLSFGYAR